ncbi:MAG: hypothetical protein PUC05_01840 [Firmicutes bacterium]|nr:hypothetical protein [Bacillota bacterium]
MQGSRWILDRDRIIWNCTGDSHTDTIEMAGNQISAIVTYGVDDEGVLSLHRELRYPLLRTLPKDTHATLGCRYDEIQSFRVNGETIREFPYRFVFDGALHIYSQDADGLVTVCRSLFPCRRHKAYIEHVTLTNRSDKAVSISAREISLRSFARGAKGVYPVEVYSSAVPEKDILPQESIVNDLVFSARLPMEEPFVPDGAAELEARMELVHQLFYNGLDLTTGDDKLDCMFRFAKLRAAESIFDTAAGPLHSPGGGSYYAAVWTNDQIEYAAPFFPFLGYERANEACRNALELYIPFMGENLYRIPSSIIDEGNDIWEGAGDRGDAAMYLYGITRFLLANGRPEAAEHYFDAIDWCVRYCRSKVSRDGVIASDSDELEGRFPAGDANLCTSCLTYAGLLSAADIAKELGKADKQKQYALFASELRGNIERFFGAEVSGYRTYRYYNGNTLLRSWICIPLTVGITDRKEETVRALLSDRLFGENGLVCQEGNSTFWDRATLYALRGILNAGHSDEVYGFLQHYVNKRLLSEHVPYAVEAYPEGNQRHLSAESALFARVITEGMLGFVPRGFRSFDLRPSVPAALDCVAMRRIRAFNDCFDITVRHTGNGYRVCVKPLDGCVRTYEARDGEILHIEL